MRRRIGLLLLLSACVRRDEELAARPSPSSSNEPSEAAPPSQIFERDGSSIRVPNGWVDLLPKENEKRRELFALKLNTPSSQPDVLVLVARPTVFRGSTDDLATFNAALANGTKAPAKLADMDGVVVTSVASTPNRQPTKMRQWAATRDGIAFTVMCSGTGAAGIALADQSCESIVASYRPPTALQIRAVQAPAISTLVAQKATGFTIKLPEEWELLPAPWLTPPAIALYRSPRRINEVAEDATVTISADRTVTNAEAAGRELARAPMASLIKAAPFELPEGRGVETEIAFVDGAMLLAYDVVAKGELHEITCRFPKRLVEAFRPVCRAIAKSFRKS